MVPDLDLIFEPTNTPTQPPVPDDTAEPTSVPPTVPPVSTDTPVPPARDVVETPTDTVPPEPTAPPENTQAPEATEPAEATSVPTEETIQEATAPAPEPTDTSVPLVEPERATPGASTKSSVELNSKLLLSDALSAVLRIVDNVRRFTQLRSSSPIDMSRVDLQDLGLSTGYSYAALTGWSGAQPRMSKQLWRKYARLLNIE